MTTRRLLPAAALLALAASVAQAAEPMTFDFAKLAADATYSDERGHGYEPDLAPKKPGDPFVFSAKVPEGNYDVTITFGGDAAATTSVKAEARRLMLEGIGTKAGETLTRTIAVNVHTPQIAGTGDKVKLKPGEDGPNWDDKLTLEFLGSPVAVRSVTIAPSKAKATLYIAGDSTVLDGPREPWTGWGQMMPRFFKPDVVVANYAWSGETLRSFRGERRLAKILSTIKSGDWLLIQFGHNDMKEKGDGVGPFTSFSEDLRKYVAEAKAKGANVVVMTPMARRRFEGGKTQNTHGDYPEAIRKVAAELGVPLVDLQASSIKLFDAMGNEGSKAAFVHYPADTFPGQDKPLADNSHFNNYGAYELARCVVQDLRQAAPELAAHLADDVTPFDPTKPDDAATFDQAMRSLDKPAATTKPEGS